MSGFINELKRRNVIRAAVLYLGTAWLILQVFDVIGQILRWPESYGQFVLVVLAAGFPVAMLLSWFYQFTSTGIRAESDSVDAPPISAGARRRSDKIIIAILSFALVLFVAKEVIDWKGDVDVDDLVDLGQQQLVKRTDSSVADAERNFRRAIAIDSNSAPAYAGLGEALIIQSFYQSAAGKKETYAEIEQIIVKGQLLDPTLGEFFVFQANLKWERDDDLDAAEQLYVKAIELSPDYARGFQWYAEFLLFERGRYEEALALLKRALKIRPFDHIFVSRVMWVRMNMGGRSEDIDLLLESIRHHPNYLDNYVHMTYALMQEGRFGEALKWARHITREDPDDVRRRMNLECWCLDLLQQNEELKKCVADAEKEFANAPRSAKLARLYTGSAERAVEEAKDLMQSGPAELVLQSDDVDERRINRNLVGMIPDILADSKEWDIARDFQEWLGNPVFLDPDWKPSEKDVSSDDQIVFAIINAAILYETGDKEKGDQLFDLALDRINSEELTLKAGYSYRQIWVHAFRGDKEAAKAYLKVAMVDQWQLEDWHRLHDPVFNLLLDEPRWIEMLVRLKDRAESQWQWYVDNKDEPLFEPLK